MVTAISLPPFGGHRELVSPVVPALVWTSALGVSPYLPPLNFVVVLRRLKEPLP